MMLQLHLLTDLARWSNGFTRFIKSRVLVSTRVTRAICHIVWLIITQFHHLALLLLGVLLSICSHVLSLGSHILLLAGFIILVSCIKALNPRYQFIVSERQKVALRKRELVERCYQHSMRAKSVITKDYEEVVETSRAASIRDELVKLVWRLCEASSRISKICMSSVTDQNIQSIYKSLAWSDTRREFERVYWFNHSVQTFWPSLKTLLGKGLQEIKAKARMRPKSEIASEAPGGSAISAARKNTVKAMLIKESDIQCKRAKMSVYLSCRRQLELLRQRKELILKKGDEYLGQKVAIILIYLVKKFILCSKQYFIEQVTWLIEFVSSLSSSKVTDNAHNQHVSGTAKNKVIELDLKEILRRQNVKFKGPLVDRQTRSAGEALGRHGGRRPKPPGVRFKSAPEFGLPCNSRRIVNAPSGLIRLDGLKSLQMKRQKLARSVNKALLEQQQERKQVRAEKSKSPPKKQQPLLSVDRLELGNSAPLITSIKYLEKGDRLLMAETLRQGSQLPASDANNMRIIIELSYETDPKFNIKLSSVPVLDEVRITRLALRLRLLVSVNHKDFDDHKNVSIINAIDSDRLLPILNHVQVALVDTPRFDWHLESVKDGKQKPGRARRRRLVRRSEKLNSLFQNSIKAIKRNLQPLCVINHPYFKYLTHAAISCIQHWFQPFDIRIGDQVYIKTLW